MAKRGEDQAVSREAGNQPRRHIAGDLDLNVQNAATPAISVEESNRLSVLFTLASGTWGTAEVEIEGSIDQENWTVFETVVAPGLERALDVSGFVWVRARVNVVEGGVGTADVRWYSYIDNAPEAAAGPAGDVEGPASSTDNAIARFDGATGKFIQDSAVTVEDDGDIVLPGTVNGRDVAADGAVLDTFTPAGLALMDDADAAAQRTTLGVGTADSPELAAVNVGHATDTTLARSAAGKVAVEGKAVPLMSGAFNLVLAGPAATRTWTGPDADATLVTQGGALGTPASGVATNLTGVAAGLTAGTALSNFSTADQAVGASTTDLLVKSTLAIPVGKLRIGTILKWRISVSKTGAGTAALVFLVKLGTAGTVADATILTFTCPVGTAVVDNGFIEISVVSEGPLSASGLLHGTFHLAHNLSTTGLVNLPNIVLPVRSGVTDVTVANLIASVAVTTGASYALTFSKVVVEALNL